MPTHSSSSLASWWLSIVNSISQCASAWEGKKLLVPEHGHRKEDQALLKGRREEADRWMVVVVDFMSSRNTQSTAPKLHSSRHREHREQSNACLPAACCLTRGYRSGYRTHIHTQTQADNEKEKENTVQRSRTELGRQVGSRERAQLSLSLSLGSFLLQHRVDIAISQIEESWVSE